MEWIDVSLPVWEGLPVWPGTPPFSREWRSLILRGDKEDDSLLHLGSHLGTHVDAPRHYVSGASDAEGLRLEDLVGNALVVECPGADHIDEVFLEGASIPENAERVLFRTRNSENWRIGREEFDPDFVALSSGAALWLRRRGVRLVGVDYLSVGPFGAGLETHRILLEAGIVIVEGLNLSDASAGTWEFVCLPLRIRGGEAAPARAILRRAEG